jgi:hypothetical protein
MGSIILTKRIFCHIKKNLLEGKKKLKYKINVKLGILHFLILDTSDHYKY